MKTAAFLTVALIALCSTPAAADRNKKPTQWSVACQILLLVVASQFLCCSRAEAPRLQSAKEAANDKKALGASSKAEQVMKCSPLSGADQIWSRPALQWVLIGEQHGNNETPAAFFNLVCDALVKRKQVTVAVEHPVDEQAALDGIVMSPDFESAQRVLLNQPSWKNGMDGRASSAMLLLLVSLRELHPKFSPDRGCVRCVSVGEHRFPGKGACHWTQAAVARQARPFGPGSYRKSSCGGGTSVRPFHGCHVSACKKDIEP